MEEAINSNHLVRSIEIYENERYQLSAMGWSPQGLLPTDRFLHLFFLSFFNVLLERILVQKMDELVG